MKKIALFSILIFSFWSCKDIVKPQEPSALFIENNSAYGLYVDGRQVFVFDESLHQTSLSDNQFRIQTDAQDKYFNIKFVAIPSQIGQSTNATITANGLSNITNGPYLMVLKKLDADRLWLWIDSKKLGAIIPRQ